MYDDYLITAENVNRTNIFIVLAVVKMDSSGVALDVQVYTILIIAELIDRNESKSVVLGGIIRPVPSALG